MKTTLDNARAPYRPEARYLVDARVTPTEAIGKFEIPVSCYVQPGIESGHLNAVDLLLGYNQLSYLLFEEAVKNGEVSGVSQEQFERARILGGLITDIERIKFSQPVNPKSFEGRIKIERQRPGKIPFFRTSLDFGENKITGKIDLAFLSDQQP